MSYKIRRGVEVEVPPEVAEVLEHSQRQDELTAARIAAAEKRSAVKSAISTLPGWEKCPRPGFFIKRM